MQKTKDKKLRFVNVSCAINPSYGVTTDGKIYVWGQNNNRSMGLPADKQYRNPTLIQKTLHAKIFVVKACAGCNFTLFLDKSGGFWSVCLTNSGVVYTWGSDSYGEIGSGDCNSKATPNKIEHLKMKQLN